MIAKGTLRLVLGFLLMFGAFTIQANEADSSQVHNGHEQDDHSAAGHGGMVDDSEEINEYIGHHLQDAHDFILYTDGETGEHVGFSLPVILWDEGLQVFSSSELDHGHSVAEVNGNFYKTHHSKIYKTNNHGEFTFEVIKVKEDSVIGTVEAINKKEALVKFLANTEVESDDVQISSHPINAPLDFSITKSVLGMLFTGLLLILLFGSLAKSYKKGPIPTGVGRFLEPLVIYVRDEIARPNIGEDKYKRYMSFLLTVFFFIWVSNLLGLTPLGFNITGQIAVTFCLALFTFFIVQFSGNKEYWGHIFWMPGVPVPMKILLAPIEVLGMFTKPFSLMIRLFANITAGHVVVMSLIALAYKPESIEMLTKGGATGLSFALTLFISVIELLVAFLQAFIFTMLSSLFIGMAVQEHDHH